MAVTIHDVAAKAGVSHTTVSWVIHDDPRITKKTKVKVWKAIEKLDYHPNYMARSLVSGRSNMIAVVASSFSTIFELEIMRGIEDELDDRAPEYSINQYNTHDSPERKDLILRKLLFGKMADAVIGLSLKPDDSLMRRFNDSGVPVVLVEASAAGAWSVKCDNRSGARAAVKHLIASGRKRIGLVNGQTRGEEQELSPTERLEGFRSALEEAGLNSDDAPVATISDYRPEEGCGALRELLAAGVDSIFCAAGDIVAMGILSEAKRMGIGVPDKLALIGFDDIFVSSLITPALTTMRQPLQLMGGTAVKFAIKGIQQPSAPQEDMVFKPELIVRDSA